MPNFFINAFQVSNIQIRNMHLIFGYKSACLQISTFYLTLMMSNTVLVMDSHNFHVAMCSFKL